MTERPDKKNKKREFVAKEDRLKGSEEVKRSMNDNIKNLEDELKKTKYNKKTQYHIGLLKAKLAQMKERQKARSTGGSKIDDGFSVRKSGDATVVLLGFPSVGKSTLLNKLTNAESKTGAYAFTTLTVIPGLMEYGHAKIQILDVPGIVKGAASGTGRGKEVIAVLRSADLILFITDAFDTAQLDVLKKEVYESGIRLDQRKPDVRIVKTSKGGICVATTVVLENISTRMITDILRTFKINNADVLLRQDISADQLIDLIEGNKHYLSSVIAFNKIDMVDAETRQLLRDDFPNALQISARDSENIEGLKKEIFKKLDFIRIYMKEIGKEADMVEPMIMKRGCTVEDVCNKIHRDFVMKFRFVRVWGESAKFPGQRFNLKHSLIDNDIVEIHIK